MDNSGASVLLATERYADKAREVLGSGLDKEPVLDVKEKILRGGCISEKVLLEEFGQNVKGGMMLYTSGTTNRPVCFLLPVNGRWWWLTRAERSVDSAIRAHGAG